MGSLAPDNDREVAGFLADVRAAYVSDPDEATTSRHMAAIAHEANLARARRTPRPALWRNNMIRNRFLRPVAGMGIAMLAAIVGTTGLAVAGVNLPDPAAEAFEKVGISLPNQAGGGESGENARSDEVRSVIEATPSSERDCAFGHRVAEAAKGSPVPEQAQDACDRSDEDGGAGEGNGDGSAESNSNSQFGRETAERARGLGDATVEERRSFGEETSEQATQLGGAPDESPGADARPEGTPGGGAPEGTLDGPPDTAPIPEGTPTGPPEGTPTGPPEGTPGGRP
jgi:hypothetical protein